MEAGNEGAGRENSFGLGIRLPHETGSNPHIAGDVKDITFKYFFTRKLAFLKDSHAVVCCPGGYGTHDEGFETLTLMQTGKAQLMPVVCLAPEGNPFWINWDNYVKETLLAQGMISPADLSLYKVTQSVEEAVDEICHFYRRYHSYRFVNEKIVVRLTQPISPAELDHLNSEYSDLLEKGTVEPCESPHGKRFDQSLESLPAITFHFRWGRYGRLREMINWLNDCEVDCPDIAPEHGEGGRLPVEQDDLGDE
jgi:predicted Rossmann-fold nucleotide-binding protein